MTFLLIFSHPFKSRNFKLGDALIMAIINSSFHKVIVPLKSRYFILKCFCIKVLASWASPLLYAISRFCKFGHEFKMQLIDLSESQHASENETLVNHGNF